MRSEPYRPPKGEVPWAVETERPGKHRLTGAARFTQPPQTINPERREEIVVDSSTIAQPAPFCRCPRTGDLWLCAGRPELANHPDGSRCALGATVAASGNDYDPRELLARALKEAGCRE